MRVLLSFLAGGLKLRKLNRDTREFLSPLECGFYGVRQTSAIFLALYYLRGSVCGFWCRACFGGPFALQASFENWPLLGIFGLVRVLRIGLIFEWNSNAFKWLANRKKFAPPCTVVLLLVITALILRLKIGTLVGSWFCFTLIIVYLGGIIVIFAYLSRLVQPIKINLLRSSIVLAGLLLLGGPIRLRALLLNLTRHETWTDTRFFFRNLALVVFMVVYLLLALLSVYRLCEKQEGPMKRV